MNRRTFSLSAAAIFLTSPLIAQGAKLPHATRPEPALYEFKHLDNSSADAVCELATNLFHVLVKYNPVVHAATVSEMAGSVPDGQKKTLDLLKRYDAPPPSSPHVRYVAYLIRASNTSSEDADELVSPIPQQLNDAIAEMKSSFAYANYDLLATVTSVSQGGASASDSLPGKRGVVLHNYDIEYGNVTVAPDRKSVNIRPFKFMMRTPGIPNISEDIVASIGSDVTVHEGQKLVLGKVRMSLLADVFVILTVKVE